MTISGSAGQSDRPRRSLVLPDENTNGVEVRFPWLSIELNGSEIVRSACETETLPCRPASGSGYGVRSCFSPSQDFAGTRLSNGSIRRMGADGVRLSSRSTVADLRVESNLGNGIRTAGPSPVSGNVSKWNVLAGIVVGQGSIVSQNVVNFSVGSGIDAASGTIVSGNTVLASGEASAGSYGLHLHSTAA